MYKKNNNITFFWIAIIISIIGIAVISGFFIANLEKKLSVDKTTEATYIEQNYETNSDNEKIYKPIYHYVVNDKEYTCEASFVVNSEEITSGTVHYNSNNPQKCMIDYNYSHFNSIYLLLIVDVFLLFCLVLLIKSIKSIKKKSNMIEYLKGNGEIVKNVPHELKTIGTTPEDINDTIIVVKHKFPDGKTRTIESDAMPYIKAKKVNVDLLYDPKDNSINYLDVNKK